MAHRLGSPMPRAETPAPSSRPTMHVRPDDMPGHIPDDRAEYASFGNAEARNGLQERLEIPLMIRALALPRGGRVLEVGCGRGVALPVLSEQLLPASLTAVDIDETLVAIARERVAAAGVVATVVEGDVRSLPFDDRSFDVVIDFGTCYHISGGSCGALSAMSEIARVLVPGGLFVHETPVAQFLAHPIRSFGRTLPWKHLRGFVPRRSAVLWTARRWVG